MKQCEYMNADWFKALQTEVDASNKTVVARKMQVNRSTLSAVMNGIGEYGKGKASTSGIELQFRRAYEQLTCPHTLKVIGIADCRSNALGPAPTHNPRQTMHWQACQYCANKPPPLKAADTSAVPKPKRRKVIRIESEPVQQAGIIDKVTLPLPIVGGPQINEQTAQEAA
ncbi:MarR family transcriptional regulator [Undibacterium sp. Di27W]|uniref:MarR family transcriptional regulator n=1 Tax=Undibacterium sp. Di27W TaxID=3413036 RepID=UPI003BF2A590